MQNIQELKNELNKLAQANPEKFDMKYAELQAYAELDLNELHEFFQKRGIYLMTVTSKSIQTNQPLFTALAIYNKTVYNSSNENSMWEAVYLVVAQIIEADLKTF